MTLSRTLGGAALVLAAVLNLTRMIPVFANMPEGLETFPPQTAEEIASHYEAGTSGYGLGGACVENRDGVRLTGPDEVAPGMPGTFDARFEGLDDGGTVTHAWSAYDAQ